MTRYSTWRSRWGRHRVWASPAAQMTIGEFSRRSQLSLKALRLYERLGLLRPVAVDQRNGYRRYHESQLYTARLIVMLRLLDMPLPEVGRVVSASQSRSRGDHRRVLGFDGKAVHRPAADPGHPQARRSRVGDARPGAARPRTGRRAADGADRAAARLHRSAGLDPGSRRPAHRTCCAVRRRSGRAFRDLPRHGHRRQRWPGRSVRPGQAPAPGPGRAGLAGRARAPGSLYPGNQDTFRDSRDLVDLRPAGALGSRSRPQARRSTQRGLPARCRTALRAAGQQICDVAIPFATSHQLGSSRSDLLEQAGRPASRPG